MKHEARNELAEAIISTAKEIDGKKKLSCADALRLAQEHGVSPDAIGKICDDEKIKLHTCQLGCF